MTDIEAIDVLFTEWKCIDRNDGIHCDRKCEYCDLVLPIEQIRDAYNLAITALERRRQIEAQDVPDINVGDMVSMSGTSYIGDGFYYSQEMREQARGLEAMTNPLFVPGSSPAAAYLRGGNYRYREHYGYRGHYGYGAHIGMTREELDMLHDAENEKGREET